MRYNAWQRMTEQYQEPNINQGIGILSDGTVVLEPARRINFVGFQVQPNGEGQVRISPLSSIASLDSSNDGMTLSPGTTYFVDTSGGDVSLNMPAAEDGGEIRVKNTGGNVVTLSATGSDSIDGGGTYELVNLNDAVVVISNNQSLWGIW